MGCINMLWSEEDREREREKEREREPEQEATTSSRTSRTEPRAYFAFAQQFLTPASDARALKPLRTSLNRTIRSFERSSGLKYNTLELTPSESGSPSGAVA